MIIPFAYFVLFFTAGNATVNCPFGRNDTISESQRYLMPNAIVIADANVGRRRALEQIVIKAEIRQCDDAATLQRMLLDSAPAVVVIGSLGDGPTGVIEAAYFVRNLHPAAKVIVVADRSSEAIAIGALRAGVFEYLKAPVDPMEIAEAISRAMPPWEEADDGFKSLVGTSEPIRKIKELIGRIAPLNTTVLITGESGTGKEIVARLIHQHSRRLRAPFVCVNCAAIPDSLVESELFGHERGAFTGAVLRQTGQMRNADQGTLFLDEIGDMSPLAQSKMLRTLEQREIQPLGSPRPVPVDFRLIAATHRDLEHTGRGRKIPQRFVLSSGCKPDTHSRRSGNAPPISPRLRFTSFAK